MVTEKLFVGLVLAAGETSAGRLVDLGALGASGYFGCQVDCSVAVTLTFEASAAGLVPLPVSGDNVLVAHDGSGSKMYCPEIPPYAKIWIYVTAPAASGATVSVTLNIW